MKSTAVYNLGVESTETRRIPPRVGLLRERTGVPVVMLYLQGLTSVIRRELHSLEDVEAEILASTVPWNRRAWECALPFFALEGSSMIALLLPIPCSPTLADWIGQDGGLQHRSGIHALTTCLEHADLIVVPQASDALSVEDHEVFYRTLADWATARDHYFILGDLPKATMAAREMPAWLKKAAYPNVALYYPWIMGHERIVPPAIAAAAAYQLSDAAHGINQIPANRTLPNTFRPLIRHTPSQVDGLLEQRINVFQQFDENDLRIWGGRTLADPLDFDNRFISTRRTMTALKEAVHQICEPYVLEPLKESLASVVDIAIQTAFRPILKVFDSNAKRPFETDIAIVSRDTEDVLNVDVRFHIPYAVDQMSFSLGLTS
jgi:hypothetical protein